MRMLQSMLLNMFCAMPAVYVHRIHKGVLCDQNSTPKIDLMYMIYIILYIAFRAPSVLA